MKKSTEMTREEAEAGLDKQFAEQYAREQAFVKQFAEELDNSPLLKKQETDIEKAIKLLEDDRCKVNVHFDLPRFRVRDVNFHNMELDTLFKEHVTVNRTVKLFYTLLAGTDVESMTKKMAKIGYKVDKYSYMDGLYQSQFVVECPKPKKLS